MDEEMSDESSNENSTNEQKQNLKMKINLNSKNNKINQQTPPHMPTKKHKKYFKMKCLRITRSSTNNKNNENANIDLKLDSKPLRTFKRSQELFQKLIMDEERMKTLNEAAFLSRMPSQKITALESYYFRHLIELNAFSLCLYIIIRNSILHIWLSNPKVELTVDYLLSDGLKPPLNSDEKLIRSVHKFLERFGLINFGIFEILTNPILNNRHIIIIGAGIAGLSAANQLTRFGFHVTVLEGRNRVGGRILTFRKNDYVADLGAMVVTGLGGNPVSIISKQINMELHAISQGCPLYDSNGQLIDKSKDELIEKEFNRILEATSQMSHKFDFNYFHNKPLSLGQAFDFLIQCEESRVLEKREQYLHDIQKLKHQLNEYYSQLLQTKKKMLVYFQCCRLFAAMKDCSGSLASYGHYRKLLKALVSKEKRIHFEIKLIKQRIHKLEENIPADRYMSDDDVNLLNWHKANLEFANATPLENLSLKHWNQDDDFEFSGSHLTVRNGYSCLPTSLAKNINVSLNTCVQEIRYSNDGVVVLVKDSDGHVSNYTGDAVLCTLPLGVLKVSTSDPNFQSYRSLNSNFKNAVKFEPQLPNWKIGTIHRLGFGNLNKVVLCFDKIFWDQNKNLFGHVNQTSESRGEFFLFWYLYEKPVLLALIAGHAATKLEMVSDSVIIDRCVKILRNIFGESKVPNPRETCVTRWRTDPYSYGSYSYVGTESSGFDYDLMASPVKMKNSQTPRLFFAGEHTIRNYPATVHGAFLSGLREASKIADFF